MLADDLPPVDLTESPGPSQSDAVENPHHVPLVMVPDGEVSSQGKRIAKRGSKKKRRRGRNGKAASGILSEAAAIRRGEVEIGEARDSIRTATGDQPAAVIRLLLHVNRPDGADVRRPIIPFSERKRWRKRVNTG